MADFQTKNRNLGTFWRALHFKLLVYFLVIWSILLPYDIFMDICYILWQFGILVPGLVFCTKKNLATPGHVVMAAHFLVAKKSSEISSRLGFSLAPAKERPLPAVERVSGRVTK
jgi:hypothetical protein